MNFTRQTNRAYVKKLIHLQFAMSCTTLIIIDHAAPVAPDLYFVPLGRCNLHQHQLWTTAASVSFYTCIYVTFSLVRSSLVYTIPAVLKI